MKGKTLGKRTMVGREEEEKRIAKQTVKSMLREAHMSSGSPYQMMKLAEIMNSRAHNSIDLGYIKTMLFPELYNSDVPQPLSTQSYTRFTDKKEITISSSQPISDMTTQKGTQQKDACLVWYPKTIIGPSLFLRYGEIDKIKAFAFANKPVADGTDAQFNAWYNRWRVAGSYDYSEYFSQATLIAASLSIQYIGQLQNEQGYMVGSQIYGINPGNATTDDIENGQFRVMSKPGDGLRCVYLPKDTNDFMYYPSNKPQDYLSTAVVQAKNGGARPRGEVTSLASTGGINAENWIPGVSPAWPTWSSENANVVPFLEYSTDGDCVMIYWKGLSASQTSDLRIDVIRKFNGFPRAKYRDILDLTKPKKIFDPKKTIDVIQELQSAIPQLAGHSLKQMDRVSDQIQEFLPNIGHLYDEGLLKEGTSLEGFATQLQQIAGSEGPAASVPGRIYDS